MATHLQKIFFDGREETIRLLDTGAPLVGYLARENSVCPLIGNQIQINKVLGKGAMGEVFDVTFGDTDPTKRYAMKKVDPPVEPFIQVPITGRKMLWKEISSTWEVPVKELQDFNKIPANKRGEYITDVKDNILLIPAFLQPCNNKGGQYIRFDTTSIHEPKYTNVDAGSVVCRGEYTEYLVSLLMGNLYRSGVCINFIDSFYFATCADTGGEYKQYTFMEQINGSIQATLPEDEIEEFETAKRSRSAAKTRLQKAPYQATMDKLKPIIDAKEASANRKESEYLKYTSNLLIQTLFAIVVYNVKYRLVHGDLHGGNVFIKNIDETTTWKGQTLHDADYFEYVLYGQSIYLPKIPYLVKIGDFGLSNKYAKPMILNSEIMDRGLDQNDDEGALIPNFYSNTYDILFFLMSLTYFTQQTNLETREPMMSQQDKEFIKSIWMSIFKDANITDYDEGIKYFIRRGSQRPYLERLNKTRATPYEILMNDEIMAPYFVRPKTGKIVTIGEL